MALRTCEALKWKVFAHPPYNPDFPLSDHFLFISGKKWLETQCFDDDAKLREGVTCGECLVEVSGGRIL